MDVDALARSRSEAFLQRGHALWAGQRRAEALEEYRRALSSDPASVAALTACAAGYVDRRTTEGYELAVTLAQRALHLAPGHGPALLNCALALQQLERLDEALTFFDALLERHPDHVAGRYQRGHVLLTLGRLPEGFADQEIRWQRPVHAALAYPATAPLWHGQEPIAGRRILIGHEQGFGDSLQMLRYVPLLAARGARVFLAVPTELLDLARDIEGVEAAFDDYDHVPDYDLHCPVMSLPLAFGTTVETIPGDVPYVLADPARAREWSMLLGPHERRRVGLVWRTNPQNAIGHLRDVPLEALRALHDEAAALDIDLVSLQLELPPADASRMASMPGLRRLPRRPNDFADTAAILENLDLLVTADTAIGHLAGAMGRDTWLLNRYGGCWRWLRGRTDSPWYPRHRLFGQSRLDDWSGVVDAVIAALRVSK